MGYQHRALRFKCGKCDRALLWNSLGALPSGTMTCPCGAMNWIKTPTKWPNVPQHLYLGPDRHARFKLYATPPEHTNEPWALPYSIRSFVTQASAKYGGCYLHTFKRGAVMGETVFGDTCTHTPPSPDPYYDDPPELAPCHIVSGWTTGVTVCPLWLEIAKLCQTDVERTFLHHYLGYARDRQFPMLIPQAWVGIADRRRPDFVMFVPRQHWNYQWLAVQLDGAHPLESADSDAARDAEIRAYGYDVVSLRPKERGYLEEVRRLVERVNERMELADTDASKVAIEVDVTATEEPPDLPF
jgi:hypothetical protein